MVSQLRQDITSLKRNGPGSQSHEDFDPTRLALQERESQLHFQLERELQKQVNHLRSEQSKYQFELDRQKFQCFRLFERATELNEQLCDAMIERDQALLKYCQVKSNQRLHNDEMADNLIQDINDLKEKTNEYVRTISGISYSFNQKDIRIKLKESEDKLAWYEEVMQKLNNKNQTAKNRSTEEWDFNSLGVNLEPQNPKLLFVKAPLDIDVSSENSVNSAIKSDPESFKKANFFILMIFRLIQNQMNM